MHGRGCAWLGGHVRQRGGMHGGEAYMAVGGGHAWWGHAWQGGACVIGGMHGKGGHV